VHLPPRPGPSDAEKGHKKLLDPNKCYNIEISDIKLNGRKIKSPLTSRKVQTAKTPKPALRRTKNRSQPLGERIENPCRII
jgi:hypothetical protein